MEQTETQEAAPEQEAVETAARRSLWQRRPVILLGTVALFGMLFFGLRYLAESLTHEWTDDAFLDADVVALAPKVSGLVKQVHVRNNQTVQAGELLVEIDPRDLAVLLEQKRAALKAAHANLDLLKANYDLRRAQIGTAEAATKQSAAEVAAAEAAADKARADLKRAEELIRNNTISPQEYDYAKASAAAAEANLKASRERTTTDQSKVTEANAQLETSRKAQEWGDAQAAQAEADVLAAVQNLSYARVTAPSDGYVTKKAVESGDYVMAGQKLMALVPRDLYVTANFKETQVEHIRPGQAVKVTIDSAGDQAFDGHVESIMAGSGARFSLLPPENAVGNYVKVVQRIPVKILFNGPINAGHVLGPGMSVVPSVRVAGTEISEPVVVLVAALGALVIGGLWWWGAGRKGTVA
jgi:membrane fusion protein (multidrug efflux system)